MGPVPSGHHPPLGTHR